MQRRTPGPSGRRARTKKLNDNSAVEGLVSDKDAGAVTSNANKKGGGNANPLKSFLEVCDCSEAMEALKEVGIERVADLLELDAELVAILELDENLQHRLISAIQSVVQRTLEKQGFPPELAKSLSSLVVQKGNVPSFPTRGGVQAMRDALTAKSKAVEEGAPAAAVAASSSSSSTAPHAVKDKLKAFQAAQPSQNSATATSSASKRTPGKNADIIARFEAKKAELAARGRAEEGGALAHARNAAIRARFEAKQQAEPSASGRGSVVGKAAATAARFEAGSQNAAKLAIFEEKAKQAQATAAASQPPVLSQREKAMRAFGSKLER